MYSQSSEEKYILEYFGDYKGTLLSIGENDGKTFSNALRLIELGWISVLVEPSETAFDKLSKLHAGNDRVSCVNAAIGTEDGEMDFYESGTHLKAGDTSLLSTIDKSELKRWENTDNEFTLTKTKVLTYKSLLEQCKQDKFDFITTDAEGMDIAILRQIDLTDTRLICIEHNSVKADKDRIVAICAVYGLNKIIYDNAENIIIGR